MSSILRAIRSSVRQPVLLLLVLGLSMSLSGCLGVPSQYRASEPLALQKSTFGPYKYTYEGDEAKKVMGMVTYSASFKDVLAQQPDAMQEAQRAVPFQYIGGVSGIAFGVYAIVTTVRDINRTTNASSFEELNQSSTVSGTDIAIILGLGGLTIVSSLVARSHLLRAVDLFNDGTNGGDEADSPLWAHVRAAFPNTLQVNPARGEYGIGWSLHLSEAR